jgi:flagellar motor switch protein FliG
MALAALKVPFPSELTGAHRAAILVMYMDPEVARGLMDSLSTYEIREIGMSMADMERVEPHIIESVVAEFVRDLHEIAILPRTGKDFALGILPDLVDEERRDRVRGGLRRELSTEFEEYIATKPAAAICALLSDEHPQTQSVALMLMGSDNAARVIKIMDEQDQYDLALRMARLSQIPGELADDVENSLRNALEDEGVDRFRVHGLDRTAQVLGRLGKTVSEPLLARLAKTNKELSETLRRRMVVFGDLSVLDFRAIQALLREVDRGDLLLALKGATDEMRELFMSNLSKRAAGDLKEELEIMGPTPKSQVDRAQENLVETALRLHDEGVLFLPVGAEADEMV